MGKFRLPDAPAILTGSVKAWSEPVTIPTYEPMPADKNPMFLEKRVYQGSSGRVYPLPFVDRIATDATNKEWNAFHIENEYLRIMILPELGGRIHVGLDKRNGYDFFYRQNVIKPALVGLAGPWASGGVEFNWPQHHRPATYMPVDATIEHQDDGSVTIWCSDHDPMNRLKGMHGICLHPGKAYLELKVRLYNRTSLVQSFLWWTNVAVHVHEQYQSFFPEDVRFVADHAKRAISTFPLCSGSYYGVDYAARAANGVPKEELPTRFGPPGSYAPNDLSWYANIPVPTSYMALGSKHDFAGGYDHKKQAGLVHVAHHGIAPGKKQWTWGNQEFGYSWDRNLTNEDGPYIELMAGAYTDNQPDFSFLAPGETKAFSQYWYPIEHIGPAQEANRLAAVSLRVDEGVARVGVCVTEHIEEATVTLMSGEETVTRWKQDLIPRNAFTAESAVPAKAPLSLTVARHNGESVVRYPKEQNEQQSQPPEAASEPPLPEDVSSVDELYIVGLHLEQYRHATRYPEAYWKEALRRDPGDARSNNAMGMWHFRRGEFCQAEEHFRRAIRRLTTLNPNPYDGEPFYNLGLTQRFQTKWQEAYESFYKATWNYAWRAAAYHSLGELDVRFNDWQSAKAHLTQSLRTDADQLNARNLLVVVLQRLGEDGQAKRLLDETLSIDPADQWAQYLSGVAKPFNNQMVLDLAFDYARSGLHDEACAILGTAKMDDADGTAPLIHYTLAFLNRNAGREKQAEECRKAAATAPPDYCFPNRLEEYTVLEAAAQQDVRDARARYYLGNFLYDRKRYREAIEWWESSSNLAPGFATAHRNLGIAYYNVMHDEQQALAAFDRALECDGSDARVLFERDQLWKRVGFTPEKRLAELQEYRSLVPVRDDLTVEFATLCNQVGQHQQALELLLGRQFQPWEGGEGLVVNQYVRTCMSIGMQAVEGGDAPKAQQWFRAALSSPPNAGEAKHPLVNPANIYYWLGKAVHIAGEHDAASQWWRRAARTGGDFQQMAVQSFSEMSYYKAIALRELGEREKATQLLIELLRYAEALSLQKGSIDYFATSLPAMLLFNEDLDGKNRIAGQFLRAQALAGLGDDGEARSELQDVLRQDPNHGFAHDFLLELELQQTVNKNAQRTQQ